MLRRLLRPLAGRSAPLWRAVRSPALRHRTFADPADTLFYALSLDRPSPFVVCLGANDVGEGDPLLPFLRTRWRGLLVEPVPYVFRRLEQRFGGNGRLLLENAAVAGATGTTVFHFVRESSDLPPGYDHLGSLSRPLLESHAEIVPELDGRIVHAAVPCFTFSDLLARHHIGAFDLLVMDLEGFDAAALRQIDFRRHRPLLITFEHIFMSDDERTASDALLRAAGYTVVMMEQDAAALRADAGGALRRAWPLVGHGS